MMETLINDLMDLAKLESNNFKFDEKYFNPVQSIKNAFQVLLTNANQKGIKLIAQM